MHTHPNTRRTGTEWTVEEEMTLLKEIKNGCPIPVIARNHQRTKGSILSRLCHKRFMALSELPELEDASDTETCDYELEDASTETCDFELVEKEASEQRKVNVTIKLEPEEPELAIVEVVEPSRVKKEVLPYITCFDTETTGLPPKKEPVHHSEAWNVCRVLQVAYEKYTHDGQFVEKQCFLVKPTFPIPAESTAIHHITEEHALEHGISHDEFIHRMCELVKETEIFVAHNASFDKNVILSELYRSAEGRAYVSTWEAASLDCTMSMGVVEFGDKFKLDKLYAMCHLPKLDNLVLHSADWDTALCSAIYFYLRKKNGSNRRFDLHVDFDDKDVVKELGGKFDWNQKKWYVYEGDRFCKYLVKWFNGM
jgi:DNA polymerase III epsilon subunit-like protein